MFEQDEISEMNTTFWEIHECITTAREVPAYMARCVSLAERRWTIVVHSLCDHFRRVPRGASRAVRHRLLHWRCDTISGGLAWTASKVTAGPLRSTDLLTLRSEKKTGQSQKFRSRIVSIGPEETAAKVQEAVAKVERLVGKRLARLNALPVAEPVAGY